MLLRSDPTVNLDADAGDGFAPEFGLMHAASKVGGSVSVS